MRKQASAPDHDLLLVATFVGTLAIVACSPSSPAPDAAEASSPQPSTTLELPKGADALAAQEKGRIHFDTYACWRCHALGAEMLPGNQDFENLGPDLEGVGERLLPETIYESLVSPNRRIAEPKDDYVNEQGNSKMPPFDTLIPAQELLELTTFLAHLKTSPIGASPIDVNESNFEREVEESDALILLDFWAEWCVPCLELEPVLATLAVEQGQRLKICRINVDDNPNLVAEYVPDNIFPCLVLLENNILKDRVYGTDPTMEPKAFLDQWIAKHRGE